jgi:hypothetical protein
MSITTHLTDRKNSNLFFTLLITLFSTLVIDGLPWGSLVLHEFGARLTNFLLIIPLIAILVQRWNLVLNEGFSKRGLMIVLCLLLGVPALNLPVTLLASETPGGAPLVDWGKQYGMLLWGVTSYWIWMRLLRGVPELHISKLICLGSIIPVACFIADEFHSSLVTLLLSGLRLKRDSRPSGLATEPSLYAAWIALVWPLVLFYISKERRFLPRVGAIVLLAALCITAYLSNARTIAAILVLQIAYYGTYFMRTRHGIRRFRALVLLTACAAVIISVFARSLTSLTDTDMGSNISRVGSTITAVKVAIAHPIFGVGIGQLRYFFAQYAPDFALASDEILAYATGTTESRASSFNMFVRFMLEFGFAAGIVLCVLVVWPIIAAFRLRSPEPYLMYAVLSAIGGVGFWLSQDQYGYEPAILSLALVANAVAIRKERSLFDEPGPTSDHVAVA